MTITATTSSPIAFGELKGWLRELSASQSPITLSLLQASFPHVRVEVPIGSKSAHTRPLSVVVADRARYSISLEFSDN